MKSFFLVFLLLLLSSCSSVYNGKNVSGPDEFVLDSYKIKEGKYAILEMEGTTYDELSDSLLQEYVDTICEDDVLQIVVYHPKRDDIVTAVQKISSSIGFRVTDGKVYLPDLPPVEVISLTLKQASDAICRTYAKEIEDMEVFVSYISI